LVLPVSSVDPCSLRCMDHCWCHHLWCCSPYL
jgi:hypothetical protein